MKTTFLSIFVLFLTTTLKSQINEEIRKKSTENKEEKNVIKSNSTITTTTATENNFANTSQSDNATIGSAIILPFQIVYYTFQGIYYIASTIDYSQKKLIAKKPILKTVTGLELFGNTNFSPQGLMVFTPRFIATRGVFSTDFRTSIMVEERLDGADQLTTFDWQIMKFNLATTNNFRFSLGSGIMIEEFSNNTFIENTGRMDFVLSKRLSLAIEGRITKDLITNTIPRQEANASMFYNFKFKPHHHSYFFLNGITTNWYETVKVNSVGVGLGIRFY